MKHSGTSYISAGVLALLLLSGLCGFSACRKSEEQSNQNANVQEVTIENKPVKDNPVFVLAAGGIQFTAPQGWKSPNDDKDDDDAVTLTSPDEALEVTFYVPDDESFEAAQKDIIEDLGGYIKNAKIRDKEARETVINGLKAVSIPGSGEDAEDGHKVDWALTIIQAQKPVFVISIAAPENFPKHAAAYETLVQSIKPVAVSTEPQPQASPSAKAAPTKK